MSRTLRVSSLLLSLSLWVACEKPAESARANAKEKAAAPLVAAPAKTAPSSLKAEFPADTPVAGEADAKLTLVIFSDFQCPFCARAVPTVKELQRAYGKDLRVLFRNQPLPFHSDAALAAEAALAANEQGKFWEYHGLLFSNPNALDRASLEKHAAALALDAAKFKSALDSGKFKARVQEDAQAAVQAGVSGTPTFFINGRKLVGAQPVDAFKSVITEEIARADKLIAQGVSRRDLYARLLQEVPAPAEPSGSPAAPPAKVENLDIAGAPTRGPKDAPVSVVIFSDFQCPFCSRALPTLKALEEEYKGKIKLAFKQQPLPFHDKARLAAEASLAAAEQGKFWEYHDQLFAHQDALDRASLEAHAQKVGLNVASFKAALDSGRFGAKVNADMQEASRAGVNGTPTFFINGRRLVGAQPVSAFKVIIDEELSKAAK